MSDAAFGRGRRSRAVGYTRPKPSFEGAAAGQDPLQRLAMDKSLDSRIKAVETKGATGTFSSDKQAPVTKPPAQAGVSVENAGTSLLSVAITNPEFLNPQNNPSRTPILHRVRVSSSPNFSSDVQVLPVSTQTHYIIGTKGKSVYVETTSSQDGVIFNKAQVTGPHR